MLGSCLPPVSYLTRLDVYTMSSLIYLSAVMACHGLTAIAPQLDSCFAWLFFLGWLAYTAVFLNQCVLARGVRLTLHSSQSVQCATVNQYH